MVWTYKRGDGMIYREKYEEMEYERLSKYAAKSAETIGRLLEEEKCEVRNDHQPPCAEFAQQNGG